MGLAVAADLRLLVAASGCEYPGYEVAAGRAASMEFERSRKSERSDSAANFGLGADRKSVV